jgi:flagellar biosynthetic protein FlhB
VSESRTQEATPQKLARARARGDSAFTLDWVSSALLGFAYLFVVHGAPPLWAALSTLMRRSLAGDPGLSTRGLQDWLAWAGPLALWLAALPFIACVVVLLQRGFALRALNLGDDRGAGPAQRVAGAFGLTALQRGAAALLKLALLAWVLWLGLRDSLPGVLDAGSRTPTQLIELFGRVAADSCMRAALMRERSDEQREYNGDPRLHAERRARAGGRFADAALAELEDASVVIAAARAAVALRYRPERDAAPILWLKAQDALAERMIARAQALGLPIEVDASLVADLYRLEPSESIPQASHARIACLLVQSAPSKLDRVS